MNDSKGFPSPLQGKILSVELVSEDGYCLVVPFCGDSELRIRPLRAHLEIQGGLTAWHDGVICDLVAEDLMWTACQALQPVAAVTLVVLGTRDCLCFTLMSHEMTGAPNTSG